MFTIATVASSEIMASRPLFLPLSKPPFYSQIEIDFEWHPGFAVSQKQKSIKSLHDAALAREACFAPLEISSKSEFALGRNLSAFNLQASTTDGQTTSVENLFQSCNVFEDGGPFRDLMTGVSPADAKKDPRLKQHGLLIGFQGDNDLWPTEPKTLFYDWIYIQALIQSSALTDQLSRHDGFTDIEFNPKKSFSCQARSVAIWKGLSQANQLRLLEDELEFRKTLSEGTALIQRLL